MTSGKRITATVTIQFEAGQASMAKAGQVLGAHGVNIVEVVRTYNAATADQRGEVIPAVITIYEDRSFSLALKTPPTSVLLRRAAGITKGAAGTDGAPVATVSTDHLREVALRKLPDLNTTDLDAAMRIVAGTARSMGIGIR
jgi:large subunit ribosomal protein L11